MCVGWPHSLQPRPVLKRRVEESAETPIVYFRSRLHFRLQTQTSNFRHHSPQTSIYKCVPLTSVSGGVCFRFRRCPRTATAARSPISDFIFQISCFRFRISDFRFQISDLRFEISDFSVHILDFRFQISGWRFHISNFKFEVSDFGIQMLGELGSRFWGNRWPAAGGTRPGGGQSLPF